MKITLSFSPRPLYLRKERARAKIEFVTEWPPILDDNDFEKRKPS